MAVSRPKNLPAAGELARTFCVSVILGTGGNPRCAKQRGENDDPRIASDAVNVN
jgi:hypothetical protein